MIMNWAEKAVLNNPVRRAVQRHYEAPLLKRLGTDLTGAHVVELGCGEGAGAQTLIGIFGAASVRAVDLDPRQVDRALRRTQAQRERISVTTGDITALPFQDASVDAVIDFGTVHHVPDWRAAVRESARVLSQGGQLVFEEVTRQALDRAAYRLLFDHPRSDRFTGRQFIDELELNGLLVGGRHTQRVFGDFIIGVAEKQRL